MKQRLLLALLALACLSCQAISPRFAVLVFSKTAGFHHDSIPAGIQAIQTLGVQHGFDVDSTGNSGVFTDAGLRRYRVVVFLNTTGDVLGPAEQAAFENFVRNGGGFAGIHSAADTEYDWPWYGGLVGAYFASHPAVQSATVRTVDANHPSTETLPVEWIRTDEWYDFRGNPRPDVGVLLTVDESTYSGGGMGPDHPISWRHQYEGGRAWYTAMGHTIESYSEPLFLAHILGGIRWAANIAPVATPPLPVPDVEEGGIRSGYAILTPDTNSTAPGATVTFGTVEGGNVQSQAGIIAAPLTMDASLFVEVNSAIQRDLGVAVANPSGTTTSLTLTLRASDGTAAAAPVTISLPPYHQVARFAGEFFSGTAGFIGSLHIQSPMPFSVLGLRFSGAHFSVLPVVSRAPSENIPLRTVAGGVAGGTSAIIFPQFAMGGGWATQIALVNDSSDAISGRLDVFDTSGNPMPVKLNGLHQSTFIYSLPPGATTVLAPRDANGQTPM